MITYELSILIGVIVSLLFVIISLLRKTSKYKVIVGCIFIVYLSIVASITLFPIIYQEKIEYYGDTTWFNFIPFKSIIGMFEYGINLTTIVQILGNILMTVPFGVFVMLLLSKTNSIKLLLLALSFSISIELLQLIIGVGIDNMYRTVDIDDVILNIIGVYVGYLFYKIIPNSIKSIIQKT